MALTEQDGSDHPTKTQPLPAATGTFVAERLPNGWRLLMNCQLGARPVQYVLIRPEAGVALLEIDPVWTPNALDIFRQHLAQTGFTSGFPGNLPLIHRRMRPGDMAMLDMLLAEAFIWLEPLSIDADAAWEDALQALLTPAPAADNKPIGVTAPAEILVADTPTSKDRQDRLRRNAWIGLMAAGLAIMGIFLVPRKAADAPGVSALPPQPSALPEPATVPLTMMPAPPGAAVAGPPPMVDAVADIIMPAPPPVLLHAPPEAPDLLGAEPQPAPIQTAAALPEPAALEGMAAPWAEQLAPLPELAPLEALPAWSLALPEPAAIQAESPLPETIPDPEPPAPPLAMAPPIPIPAGIAPPPAPEPPAATPAPPLPSLRPPPPSAPLEPAPNLPAAARPVASMSPAEIETARRRGEALAAVGDISGARRFLERAALAGSGEAALAMAESFDPQKLAARGVIGLSPDRAAALTWYRHALALGVAEAAPRIARLETE
jgi:hypothetical protein